MSGPDMEMASGVAAFEAKEFARAMQLLQPLAEQGVAEAQYRVAIMAQVGLGMVKNCAIAVRWMRAAAEQGYALAQHGLGFMYFQGECTSNFGGSNDGVRIQNEGTNLEYWNLYTSNTTGDFEFYENGIKRSTITEAGVFTTVSDSRLKKDIDALGEVLPSVMDLQPKTYRYIDADTNRYFSGFRAQELEQVFPQFVYYGGDNQVLYTLDYAGLSVIALKAIQEQQAQIEALKKELEEIKSTVIGQRSAVSGQ